MIAKDLKAKDLFFDVPLSKGSPPQSLGFNFKKPQEDSRAKGFLIVAVIPGGVLGQYNAAQAAGGAWDRVVLPGMRIRAVNGIENNCAAMLQELKDKEAVTLRVQSNRKIARGQTPSLGPDIQDMLRERVAGLIIQNRDRIRQAMASDEDFKVVAAMLGDEVVGEVCDLVTVQQPQAKKDASGQLRPGSSPTSPTSPMRSYASGGFGSCVTESGDNYSTAEDDGGVLSDESV